MMFSPAILWAIPKSMDITTRNEQETRDFACCFAQKVRCGDVILLHGDLGAGKSVFCRALIRALCGDEEMEVPSPTFTLAQTYDAVIEGAETTLWHFDLYRLSDPAEIYEIGWEDALSGGVVMVEWPERLGALCPAHRTDIRLSGVPGQPDHRTIEVRTS